MTTPKPSDAAFVIRVDDLGAGYIARCTTSGSDRHYIVWRGDWRCVPRIVQRLYGSVMPKLFGGCWTSTVKGDGAWVGGWRV